jgi:hypothetical protein
LPHNETFTRSLYIDYGFENQRFQPILLPLLLSLFKDITLFTPIIARANTTASQTCDPADIQGNQGFEIRIAQLSPHCGDNVIIGKNRCRIVNSSCTKK